MRPPPSYLPTPEEIARWCAQFQAEWTPGERQRRMTHIVDKRLNAKAAFLRPRYSVPLIHIAELAPIESS